MLGIARTLCPLLWLAGACASNPVTFRDCEQPVETLYEGFAIAGGLAVADGEAYFTTFDPNTTHTQLRAVSTACGHAARTLADIPRPRVPALAVATTSVLVATDSTLFAIPRTGGTPVAIYSFSGVTQPAFSVVNDTAYLVDGVKVIAVSVSTADATTIASLSGAVSQDEQLVAANSQLYVAATSWIDAVDPSSGQIQPVTTAVTTLGGIAVDATAIYVPQVQGFAVVPLDGQPVHTIATSESPGLTAIDRGHLYTTFSEPFTPQAGPQESLARVSLPDGAVEILASGLREAEGLALDDAALYAAVSGYSSDAARIARVQLP